MKEIILKYKSIIWYLVLGGISTIINICSYYALYNWAAINNEVSNIIAWIVTIVFVYFTNRVKVFGSTARSTKDKILEFFKFVIARLFTGILDIGFMSLTVSALGFNSLLMKILSNIIVVISNYILSKIVVFRN